jgi:hypothetical protein
MRAAWRLYAKAGMARLKNLADWLEREYPSTASSLMEGMEECFAINRLDVLPSLHRYLAIIESPHARVHLRRAVSVAGATAAWSNGGWPRRCWRPEKNFRKIMGNRDLWALKAVLNGSKSLTRPEGVVRWQRPPLPTFNETRSTFKAPVSGL